MAQGQIIRPLAGMARAFAALQGRLYTPPQATIAGVNPQNWPSAEQPVQPVGPPGSQPLNWSFWQGVNLNITPRPDAELTFQDLRQLGTYPLARICIENIKDQIASIPWTIQLVEKPGESLKDRRKRQEDDSTIPALTAFLQYPDGETPWRDWVRPLLEDMLVIDAGNVLVRETFGGKVVQLRTTDGAEYLRLIDDQGYTPLPPSPAYTQLWEGIPRVLLSTKQLVYRPRNIVPRGTVSSHLYGMSPVEQLATEIRIGQERLRFVLSFYTEGSVPGIVQMVAPGTTPDKILEAMQWANSELSGNLAKRRQWRMMQSFSGDSQNGPKDTIEQLKEPILADAFDELHIRKIAFGFGTSPQRLLKQMNRASAESSQDSANEEGMYPWLMWLKGTMDLIIQRRMGCSQYEWIPDTATELDPVKQEAIDTGYVSGGIKTINEVRDDRGWEPRPEPEANQLMVISGTGPTPLAGAIERTQQSHDASLQPKQVVVPSGSPGAGKPSDAGPAGKVSKKKVATAPTIRTDQLTPKTEKMVKDLAFRINRFFEGQRTSIVEQVSKLYDHAITKVRKDSIFDLPTDPDDPAGRKLREDTRRALAILGLLRFGWPKLVTEIVPYLDDAGQQGVDVATEHAEVDSKQESDVRELAYTYAMDRAAEMVGMKRLDDGTLVENDDAQWAISDTTRKDLQETIMQAFAEGWTVSQLAAVIEGAYTFSTARAQMIARTEMSRAQSLASLELWKIDPQLKTVRWVTTEDEGVCDVCDALEDLGEKPIGYEFSPGVTCPPEHPNCRCSLIATIAETK